jgi:C-5 cytosine-specific DNA methylase
VSPLAIDLFCGLGGWTEGLMAVGYQVIGFDIERHVYGEAQYPSQLVLQDVLTLHGRQFKDAALIVASPPCQAYSYRAMPWKRAKALPPPDNSLFEACFRIQREAIEAAGHHIPLVVENVCGAQKWVGRARWHFGSFYLWGDVPALMPITLKHVKVPTMGAGWYPPGHPKHVPGLAFNGHANRLTRRTNPGNGVRFTSRDTGIEGVKQRGSGREWFAGDGKISRLTSSGSPARKAASAHIAKIPLALSTHIGRAWWPDRDEHEAVS